MHQRILDSQKQRDVLPAFWPRKLSPYVTALFLKTPVTPNQITMLWGTVNIANSYVVYRVLLGDYLLLPIIPLVYVLTYVLDCVDGEVARVRQMSSPIGGKLLDGISHRATEYSLLAAYVSAVAQATGSPWALPVGLLLFSGDAMGSYAYERRLAVLRAQGFKGLIATTERNVYERGERWSNLSLRQKWVTIEGQLHFKSIYAVIAIGFVGPYALLSALGVLACVKHAAWVRLIWRTLATPLPAAESHALGSGEKVLSRS